MACARDAHVETLLFHGLKPAVRGTPRNSMSRTEVIAKTRDLTAPVVAREGGI